MQELEAAIAAAAGARLDELGRTVCRLCEQGMDESVGEALFEAIQRRRRALAAPKAPKRYVPRRPRTPSPTRSRERYLRLSSFAVMPANLAWHYRRSELAVLKIVGDELKRRGRCDLCYDEIAARAGVSRSTVYNAMRRAQELGHLAVLLRPRRGAKNDTNVVTVVSREWAAWLRIGVKAVSTTEAHIEKRAVALRGRPLHTTEETRLLPKSPGNFRDQRGLSQR